MKAASKQSKRTKVRSSRFVRRWYRNQYGRWSDPTRKCQSCDGTGEIHSHNPTCSACGGTGDHTEWGSSISANVQLSGEDNNKANV